MKVPLQIHGLEVVGQLLDFNFRSEEESVAKKTQIVQIRLAKHQQDPGRLYNRNEGQTLSKF